MKRNLLLAAMMFISILAFSQASFNTGKLEFDVNEYGAIEIYTSDGIIQLDRASILVGTGASAVFDYQNDAESNEPTALVASPTHSDYEIYGAFDNTYSNDPPDVLVKLNAFGWNDKAFVIVRFNVTNTGNLPINAISGLDIIPYLNETYGHDTVTYIDGVDVTRFHRGNGVNLGVKLLSAPLASLFSFEWYDGYSVDADYYTWLTKGTIQPAYYSNTGDGPVTITAQAPKSLAKDESYNIDYLFVLGNNEADLLSGVAEGETQYDILVTESKQLLSSQFSLYNSPNPVSGSTMITYNLPVSGIVDLNVYDATGKMVAVVVNKNQSQGLHKVNFDASKLVPGIYTYKLQIEGQVITKKMVVK